MLGRFLEFSIPTADIRASLDFYLRLGFSQAAVGEARDYPYAVVTDGRICLGLHQHPASRPSLTFVKPDLLRHLGSLEQLGLEFEFRRLGNDVFNEVGWLDPSGHDIRLVEARTFSPCERKPSTTSLCGWFLEIALPVANRDAAKLYWERFGFVGVDRPQAAPPHVSCISDALDIGLYDAAHLPGPELRFEVDDVATARARLDEIGIEPAGRDRRLGHTPAALLTAPEGTRLWLTGAMDEQPTWRGRPV